MLGLFPGLQDRGVGCTHGLSDEQVQEQDTYNIIHCKTAFARILIQLCHSACTMVAVSSLTVVTCIIPWACCFVGTTYLHSKGYAAAASAKPNEHAPCTRVRNCCTEFVRFKDPAMHALFQGRRIDMETLYEMYFNEELDFAIPVRAHGAVHGSNTGHSVEGDARHVAENTSHTCPRDPCCLLNDVLSQRHDFVDFTFGLTTHLPFLLKKWIPDVLSHSKQQDVSQVRDHYDRSTFYRSSPNPFTSDEAEDDFFGMFLGKTMVYTSGIASSLAGGGALPPAHRADAVVRSSFIEKASSETLESMQEAKLRLVCRKLRLGKGQTHLDIGCGWGTLVNHSAAKNGTVATGVTLSRNQVAYAAATSKLMKIRDHRTTFWCRYPHPTTPPPAPACKHVLVLVHPAPACKHVLVLVHPAPACKHVLVLVHPVESLTFIC
jgi:hypothetical protein